MTTKTTFGYTCSLCRETVEGLLTMGEAEEALGLHRAASHGGDSA